MWLFIGDPAGPCSPLREQWRAFNLFRGHIFISLGIGLRDPSSITPLCCVLKDQAVYGRWAAYVIARKAYLCSI